MALDPPFQLVAGLNGSIRIDTRISSGLSPYIQALPQFVDDPADALAELEAWYLAPRLEGAAADITKAGYILNTTWRDPNLWTEPFAPSTALELDLPDEDDGERISFREIDVHNTVEAASTTGSVLRRPTAAQGTREYVHGSMASMPFTPGGEPIQAGSTAAMRAADEASSGRWLRELEAPGGPPEALAPGMPYALFARADSGGDSEASPAPDGDEGSLDGGFPHQNGVQERSDYRGTSGAAGQSSGAGLERAAGAKVQLDDMFKGVWLVDEEDEERGSQEQSRASEEEAEATQAGPVNPRLASVQDLPNEKDIPGAADPAADQLLSAALPKESWSSTGRDSAPPPPIAAASPAKRKPSDPEWAIRGGISNLAASFERLRPNLAMSYPFELDTFQKEAVLHLEQGHSVFVAAHTSAGKTVVAEYAFALARQHCTRAIYTSPIKTISNQKFRDFSSDFEVGLLTGDVSINPEAPCLIMTTEILRSMLYKGADIIRDIEWVIFDECHYVNDVERGVVWEEVIIMLPAHVNLVLLSATVPNVMEFADWVGRTKRKRIFVTGTTKRPVPLEHNLYYNGQLYTIARQDVFLSEGSSAARKAWKAKNAPPAMTTKEAKAARPTGRGDGGRGAPGRGPPGRGARGGPPGGGGRRGGGHGRSITAETGGSGARSGVRNERTAWMDLIKLLDKKQLLPAVVFCFSKKRVDVLADLLQALDFTTAAEKSEIHVFFEKAITRLKGNDRKLPQILRLREMLRRGLGVHHAGLLPIMKEVVEMLFCRGVIKVLFSTETFAMGVNAPARTVVFQGLRKHDGKAFRTLLPGEYTQMAGRAGRRGLDAVGTVVIGCWDDVPEEGELKTLLLGRATKLESRFRLTYTMILNLLRVEDLKVEDMLKRSFAEFHAQRAAPEALVAMEKGQAALAAVRARPFPAAFMGTTKQDVRDFHDITTRIDELSEDVQEKVLGSRAAQQALVPGRLVLLTDSSSRLPEVALVCGNAASTSGRSLLSSTTSSGASGRYYVLLLHRPSPLDQPDRVPPEAGSTQQNGLPNQGLPAGFSLKAAGPKRGASGPGPLPRKGEVGGVEYILKEVSTAEIQDICRVKLIVDADNILDPAEPQALTAAVRQLQRAAEAAAEGGGSPPILDPEKDLKINQMDLVTAIRERQRLVQIRAAMPCQREPGFGEMWALVRSEALLEDRLARLAHQLSDANLAQMPEFHQRVDVLRQLEYAAPDNTVLMKGRVACELNAGDELVTTEIVFAGVLSELTPEEAVAVLSALVFQEKSEMEGNVAPNDRLEEARGHMLSLAHQAGEVQKACGLDVVPEEYCRETLKFGLMEVVYRWALGDPFDEISELTDIMEGSIVRTVVRLDELCRQLRDAARVMGNTALFQQMEAGSAAIKRDVVFAASLYVN